MCTHFAENVFLCVNKKEGGGTFDIVIWAFNIVEKIAPN